MEYLQSSICISPYYYAFSIGTGILFLLLLLARHNSVGKSIAGGVLAAYLLLIICSTLVSRKLYSDYHYNLQLFWSYRAAMAGKSALYLEILGNIVMFIPIGLLMTLVFDLRFSQTMLICLLLTVTIEVLQLVLKCGLFEFDDVVHNMLGGWIGWGVANWCIKTR